MKLIRCHIENFGKLHDVSFDFTDGCNVMKEENGWGKSTLSMFIKVMFFGFANETKRDLSNQRKKYMPWQGGVYGGQIFFQNGNCIYELSRTFGTKGSEDLFSLRDADSNLISAAYSTNIGQEILKIDHDSFCRTVFIAQNDCQTFATDSVNAKIGNLVDNTDDINNYESVKKKLKDELNSLGPNRKGGKIRDLKTEIADLSIEVRKGTQVDQAIKETAEYRDHEESEKNIAKEEIRLLQEQQKKISEYSDLQAQQEKHLDLCNQYKERKEKVVQAGSFFPGEIPTMADITQYQELETKRYGIEQECRGSALTEDDRSQKLMLEQRFAEGIPSDDDLCAYRNRTMKLLSDRKELLNRQFTIEEEKRLEELSHRLGDTPPSERDIKDRIFSWNERTDDKNEKFKLETRLEQKEERYRQIQERCQQQNKNAKKKQQLFLLFAAIVMATGVVGFFVHTVLGVVLIVGSIILFLVALMTGKQKTISKDSMTEQAMLEEEIRNTGDRISSYQKKLQETEYRTRELLNQYHIEYCDAKVMEELYTLRSDVEKYQKLMEHKRECVSSGLTERCNEETEKIVDYLHSFFPYDEISEDYYMEYLQRIENQIKNYDLILQKEKQNQEQSQQMTKISGQIRQYIFSLKFTPSENMASQLQEIREYLQVYQTSLDELKAAEANKEEFERQHDIEKLNSLETPNGALTLLEIADQIRKRNNLIDEKNENISSYYRKLEQLNQERDSVTECEEKLQIYQENLKQLEERYRLLKLTDNYLTKAKEQFTTRYIRPILEGYQRYCHMLTQQDASEYRMDANIRITRVQEGQQREAELLSTGYQDLIGICLRMALIDAMYKEEKPFIIFDDPFVNLDEEKIQGGVHLLKEIAKEYQVIYFTCHESRI